MNNWFRNVISYYKNNPEGYWFKRKLYGWGWTPVTREGWLATLGIIGFILWNAVRFERGGYPDSAVLVQVIAPTFVAIGLLIIVCFLKGERPRWTWGPPHQDDSKDSE